MKSLVKEQSNRTTSERGTSETAPGVGTINYYPYDQTYMKWTQTIHINVFIVSYSHKAGSQTAQATTVSLRSLKSRGSENLKELDGKPLLSNAYSYQWTIFKIHSNHIV